MEAYELKESWARNDAKGERDEREWWILKPGMSDRGQGIRLFSSEEELRDIFEEWEDEVEDSDSDNDSQVHSAELNATNTDAKTNQRLEENNNNNAERDRAPEKDYIITSQLRHFIAQPYIHPPLPLPLPSTTSSPGSQPPLHKFHIRTYVLALGSLRVYVYKEMLALFAAKPYTPPGSTPPTNDLDAHLTNTCRQSRPQATAAAKGNGPATGNAGPDPSPIDTVCRFWDLPSTLPSTPPPLHRPSTFSSSSNNPSWKTSTYAQIAQITSQTFLAATRSNLIHFQPLPNAFEIFGLDFLVDDHGTVWLLEVNAFPDFGQTGEELRGLVGGLWEAVVRGAVEGFFGGGKGDGDGEEGQRLGLELVLDLDLGRGGGGG